MAGHNRHVDAIWRYAPEQPEFVASRDCEYDRRWYSTVAGVRENALSMDALWHPRWLERRLGFRFRFSIIGSRYRFALDDRYGWQRHYSGWRLRSRGWTACHLHICLCCGGRQQTWIHQSH